jgi:uncharacterized protein YegP (UPF0339 family)
LKAGNGRILADTQGRGYTTEQACKDDIDRVKNSASAPVEEIKNT